MAGLGRTEGRDRRGVGSHLLAADSAPLERQRRVQAVPRWLMASAGLAIAGVGVSGYLTLIHYDEAALICGVGDCHTVQSSRYAEIAGIPIAILGALMYATVLALAAFRWRRPDSSAATLTSVAFAVALSGVGYAAYLTWLEIAVIKAICQWCVVSAILTVGIFLAEGLGVWRSLDLDTEG